MKKYGLNQIFFRNIINHCTLWLSFLGNIDNKKEFWSEAPLSFICSPLNWAFKTDSPLNVSYILQATLVQGKHAASVHLVCKGPHASYKRNHRSNYMNSILQSNNEWSLISWTKYDIGKKMLHSFMIPMP